MLCSPLASAQTEYAQERSTALKTSVARKSETPAMSKDEDLAVRIACRSRVESRRQETGAALLQEAITYYTELQEDNEALQQERDDLLQEIAKLKTANADVLQAMTHLRQTQDNLQAQVTMLTEANARLKALVQDLTWKAKSADQLTQELHTIRKHLDDVEQERRKVLSQLRQERHAAQSELAKVRMDLTRLGETHARLTQHAEQLQQDLQGSRKRLDAGEQERRSLSDQLQQQRRKTADQLQQAQQTAQQEMARLREANVGAQAELTTLTEANARLKAMVQGLTWKVQVADQVKDRFDQERHMLEQDTLKLRREAQQGQASQEENILLRQARSGAQKELATLREANARLQAEVHKAQLAEQLRRQRPATSPQSPQPQEDDRAQLQGSHLSLQAELTTLTETNGRLEALVQELKLKLQNAEQLKEQFKEEYQTLAQEHQQLKEKSETAQEHLDRERASLYRELGAVYTKTRFFDQAVDAYTRSLEFDPTHAQAHYYLGLLYQHAKNNEAASVEHLGRYLELSPDLSSKKRKEIEYLIQMLKGKNNGP